MLLELAAEQGRILITHAEYDDAAFLRAPRCGADDISNLYPAALIAIWKRERGPRGRLELGTVRSVLPNVERSELRPKSHKPLWGDSCLEVAGL